MLWQEQGFKLLDLSRVLAGPYCTMILGDLGTEVIKVEGPNGSDDTRKWVPPFKSGVSAYYLAANRNKKSITVDLKTEDGVKVIKELVRTSDVVIHNFKTGTMERFGLDYDTLNQLNPQIVFCSITGFGETGLGKPELAEDGRFKTNPQRVKHRDELIPKLQHTFATKPTAYWRGKCSENNIPCGTIQNLEEVVQDKQLQALNTFITQKHPTAGLIKMIGSPLKLSRTPVEYKYHPPNPGKHQTEIMNKIKFTNKKRGRLHNEFFIHRRTRNVA